MNIIKLGRLPTIFLAMVLMSLTNQVTYAEPPVIEINLEERIVVGGGNEASGTSFEQPVIVNDQTQISVSASPTPTLVPLGVSKPIPTLIKEQPKQTDSNDQNKDQEKSDKDKPKQDKPPASKNEDEHKDSEKKKDQESKQSDSDAITFSKTPTPSKKSGNVFGKGTGQVAEEPTPVAQSGSCNSPSVSEAIPTMGLLLIPAGLMLRRRRIGNFRRKE